MSVRVEETVCWAVVRERDGKIMNLLLPPTTKAMADKWRVDGEVVTRVVIRAWKK